MHGTRTRIIRSLTIGLPWDCLGPECWIELKRFFLYAERACSTRDFFIRTKRLVLPPLTTALDMTAAQLRSILSILAQRGESLGLRWFCLPIMTGQPWGGEDLSRLGPAMLREWPKLFLHYLFNDDVLPSNNILAAAGERVLEISRISNNGFDNFRIGAGFNIKPDTPFFPFSWHEGGPSFSFAVESLSPLLFALRTGDTDLFSILVRLCKEIDSLGLEIQENTGNVLEYRGQDISIAPYPDRDSSIAVLMTHLGVDQFGMAGTTTMTNFLTRLLKSSLERSGARKTGFNGVMFSPLEDTGIAKAMREREITIDSLLLWSTVCGCGLDMVPVPGNVTVGSIAALYRDVGTLSRQLGKPLGVRILPIPNGRVNQLTHFNHDFLVNAPILNLSGTLENMHPMTEAICH